MTVHSRRHCIYYYELTVIQIIDVQFSSFRYDVLTVTRRRKLILNPEALRIIYRILRLQDKNGERKMGEKKNRSSKYVLGLTSAVVGAVRNVSDDVGGGGRGFILFPDLNARRRGCQVHDRPQYNNNIIK